MPRRKRSRNLRWEYLAHHKLRKEKKHLIFSDNAQTQQIGPSKQVGNWKSKQPVQVPKQTQDIDWGLNLRYLWYYFDAIGIGVRDGDHSVFLLYSYIPWCEETQKFDHPLHYWNGYLECLLSTAFHLFVHHFMEQYCWLLWVRGFQESLWVSLLHSKF